MGCYVEKTHLFLRRARSEIVESHKTLLLFVEHRPDAGELLVRQERGAKLAIAIGNLVGHFAGSWS
jgi:hypothetical protein